MSNDTPDNHDNPYGYCPICFKDGILTPGVSRERRIDGNDTCELGHVYPSKDAIHPTIRL